MFRTARPAALPGPVSVGFGRKKQKTIAPENTGFQDLLKQADPKPRFGWHNFRNSLVALLGFAGFWYTEDLSKDFHHWADQRTETLRANREETLQRADRDYGKMAMNTLARVDSTAHHLPVVGYLMDLYVNLISWEALTISLLGVVAARKRSVSPKELWSTLLKRGIQGQNTKVAIIDTGGKPKSSLPDAQMEVITPNNQHTGLGFLIPGTSLVNIIAEASPESTFLIFPAITRENAKEILKKANALYNKAMENPEVFDLVEIKKLYAPVIENIAGAVKKAVDNGADVINISYNLEQTALAYLMMRMATTYVTLGALKLESLFRGTDSPQVKSRKLQQQNLKALIQKSRSLLMDQKLTRSIDDALCQLYAPLTEALDYAYAKDVPVIMGAGNFGGHTGRKADVIGNVHPLSVINHPGLIVVGSTDCNGVVNETTSEYNDQVRPFIGANGSGEIRIDPDDPLDRPWRSKFLFPLGTMCLGYIRGMTFSVFHRPLWSKIISPFNGVGPKVFLGQVKKSLFAAPDVTLLYLKMKQVDPSLTIEEAKALMLQACVPGSFSPKYLRKLKKEIETLKDFPVSNFAEGFIDTVMTGAIAMMKSNKSGMTLPTDMGPLEFKSQPDGIAVRFTSALDGEVFESRLIRESVDDKHLDHKEPIVAWMNDLITKENQKLSELPPDRRMEKALDMELRRRVGNISLSRNRQKIVAMTEENAREKERALSEGR